MLLERGGCTASTRGAYRGEAVRRSASAASRERVRICVFHLRIDLSFHGHVVPCEDAPSEELLDPAMLAEGWVFLRQIFVVRGLLLASREPSAAPGAAHQRETDMCARSAAPPAHYEVLITLHGQVHAHVHVTCACACEAVFQCTIEWERTMQSDAD